MAVANFSSISFSGIKAEIERYLTNEFGKAGILYSPASPYGQILSVLENLHQLSILYLKNAISQLDLSQPNAINPRVIRSAAIYAGHNPGRGISATGTLKLSLKSTTDIDKDIPGGRITIANKIKLKNNTNSLDYSTNTGVETVTHRISPNYSFYLPIIQGSFKTRVFTSTGSEIQTFSISETGGKDVENFNVEVYVNGTLWSLKKHLYEMLPDEQACVVRTGFNGGIDIIFGNSGFGAIPQLAARILVIYLCTDGSIGNIFRRTRDDFKFIDDIIDGNGESVDVSRVFDVDISTDINFGSDPESILFTKSILPISSNNFVLATAQQYAYEIKKLGVFSHVNAYEKTGTIFIVATPNIRLFKNQNSNYFTIGLKAFELDQYEINKLNKYLKTSGTLQLTRRYKIQSPRLSYYIIILPAPDPEKEARIKERGKLSSFEVRENFDIVTEFLFVEGYTDTIESAELMAENISETWVNQILDEKFVGAMDTTGRGPDHRTRFPKFKGKDDEFDPKFTQQRVKSNTKKIDPYFSGRKERKDEKRKGVGGVGG